MKKFTAAALALSLASSSLLTSCDTAAGTGALVGAGIGGIVGHNTGHGGGNRTAIGAGLGAIAGALAGAAYDEHKREKYAREDGSYESYDEHVRRYPYGEPTRYVGYVRSPYRPYNIIDVRGIPHDALVVDPSVDRPFRNP